MAASSRLIRNWQRGLENYYIYTYIHTHTHVYIIVKNYEFGFF